MATGGHRFAAVQQEDLVRNEEYDWSRNVLMSDFAAHFPAYANQRSRLRKEVSSHDARVRVLAERVRNQLPWPKSVDDNRTQVAYVLIPQMQPEQLWNEIRGGQEGGYGYSYSTGGGSSSGSGPVPEGILATWDAFRKFVADASFEAECRAVSTGADDLARRLADASKQASVLAEVTALQGDCSYLRPH